MVSPDYGASLGADEPYRHGDEYRTFTRSGFPGIQKRIWLAGSSIRRPGFTISQAITTGFQRGMFSNEAGMGSSPNAAAAAATWPPHPASQGLVQMFGVFIDTIIICSATAGIILFSGILDTPHPEMNGIT